MEQLKKTVNSGFFQRFDMISDMALTSRFGTDVHLTLTPTPNYIPRTSSSSHSQFAKVSQSLDSKLHESGNCIRLRKLKNLKTPTTKCHIEYLLSSITGSFKLTHWGSLRCHYKLLFSSKSLSEVQIWTCNLQTLQSSPIAMKAPNVISHFGWRSSHYHKPHINPPSLTHLTGPPFDHLNPPSLLSKKYSLNPNS